MGAEVRGGGACGRGPGRGSVGEQARESESRLVCLTVLPQVVRVQAEYREHIHIYAEPPPFVGHFTLALWDDMSPPPVEIYKQ
jgi:hypothetical protein